MSRDTFVSKGSTRKRIDPATEDLQRDIEETLEEIKTNVEGNSPDLLDGPQYVTVNTVSKTLEGLGITLQDNVKRVTIIPDGTGIYWADGTASSSSAPFPVGGLEIYCRKASIQGHEFVTASGTVNMQVLQEG